jgi:hypothetical protein
LHQTDLQQEELVESEASLRILEDFLRRRKVTLRDRMRETDELEIGEYRAWDRVESIAIRVSLRSCF